jgi:hypothetical protein
VQECGRKLAAHLRARERAASEQKRLSIFMRYIPEVAEAIGTILSLPKDKVEKAFNEALPNFVRLNEVGGEGADGAPPALPEGAAEAAPASEAAPKTAKKTAKKTAAASTTAKTKEEPAAPAPKKSAAKAAPADAKKKGKDKPKPTRGGARARA